MDNYETLKDHKDFLVEWGNYRNMCRMSNIANIRKEQFKEHFKENKSAREIFISLHENNAIRMIESLAFRIGYNVKLEKEENRVKETQMILEMVNNILTRIEKLEKEVRELKEKA